MKIVADDKFRFSKEPSKRRGVEARYLPGAKIAKRYADAATWIVRTRTKCGAELLEGSKIKFIASANGFDHIDTVYCAKNGIFRQMRQDATHHPWRSIFARRAKFSVKNLDLSSMTIGIAGVGNVGSKVAKIAKALA